MTTSRQYDFLNRLTAIASVPSASSAVSFNYPYNAANQRTAVTNVDNSRWAYTYDALGQVVSGKKYWSDGTPVAGQHFTYSFDDIGNRKTTAAGGDQTGGNLRSATYTANTLNRYTQRTVPGYANVVGSANSTATVTVNNTPTVRKGEYFRGEVAVANVSGPAWQALTNLAVLNNGANPDIISNVTGNVFVPKTAEMFGYDADGNLTSDGRWTYTWDAENRLTKVESLAAGPTASKRKVEWTYDGQGRRIRQTTYDGSGGSYMVTGDLKFVSDAWRNIAELNAADNTLLRSYAWGLDLSGSLDGAGGVGGLLFVTRHASPVTCQFAAYDGNGNVAAMVKAADGTVSAVYEYDPFGQALRATGSMANENPFRFSTKRTDNPTTLVLYEYRVYSASLGRWLSRDPLGERIGGHNLYAFVANEPVSGTDSIGLLKLGNPIDFGNPALCYACKCKKANIGPQSNFVVAQYGLNGEHLVIGKEVPRSFDTEGLLAPAFCKCSQHERGYINFTINGTRYSRVFGTLDKMTEDEIPCKAGDMDYVGASYNNFPPDTLTTVEVTARLSITVTCDGTDGSHAESSTEVAYSQKVTFTTPSKK